MMFLFSVWAVMATDTPTLAIILGFCGTLVTALAGAIVAVSLNRKEKTSSAENSLEKTLRERILLRDEELADVRRDLLDMTERAEEAEARAAKAEQQRDRLFLAIAEQRAEERVHNDDS